tara:strand:+ start:54 stop:551 length:498 start_codon:yes stop_codon:yes gene_type:complete
MNLDDVVVDSNFESDAFLKYVDKNLTTALNDIATALQKNMKRVLNSGGTGRKHPGLPKRSSAPFHPPVVQTGTLWRSWITRVRKDNGPNKTLVLGSNLNYARFLERGTMVGGKVRMYPRPYVGRAVDKTKKQLPRINRKLQRNIKRSAFRAKMSRYVALAKASMK